MFINNINPILFSFGVFQVRYYGLIYALSFVITYFFLRTAVKNKRIKISLDELDSYFLWLILGIVVCARIFEVLFFEPKYYFSHLIEILMIWHGGLSFHGGLVGAIVVTIIFAKKKNISFYTFADIVVIPAAIALAFGRIANYLNSEVYGRITSQSATPWCVVFEKVDSYCRHPSQLYESLKNFFIFGVLIFYDKFNSKKNANYVKGTIFWIFVLLYGSLRFITNFWRDDILFYGLSVGQYFSLGMIFVATFFLIRAHRNKK